MASNKKRKTIDVSEDAVEPPVTENETIEIPKQKDAGLADIPSVSESPFAENPIERVVDESFLNKDSDPVSTEPISQEPQLQGKQNFDLPPANNLMDNDTVRNNSTSPNEFTIEDPTASLPGQDLPGSGDPNSEVNNIPKEVSEGAADGLANMILGIYGMIAPELADGYSRINPNQIIELEKKDKVSPGLSDAVKDINRKNKGAVQLTSEQKKLIKEPLVKVLEVRGVNASPETMLLIACVTVMGMHFMQAHTIKKENASYIESWMKDHSEAGKLRKELEEMKRKEKERQESEKVPYVEAEEVN